jgi:hypothetical protein
MLGRKKLMVIALSGLTLVGTAFSASAGDRYDGYRDYRGDRTEKRLYRDRDWDRDRRSHERRYYKRDHYYPYYRKRHPDIYRHHYRFRHRDRHYWPGYRYRRYDDDDWLWFGLGLMTPYLLDDRF